MSTQHAAHTREILNSEEQNERTRMILDKFGSVSDQVSEKVLYELLGHFLDRKEDQWSRLVMLKGSRTPTLLTPLQALPPETVDKVCETIKTSLKRRFAQLPALGRCWIDPKLQNLPLPTNMRTVSEARTPIVRGTRIPIENPNAKVVRFYVHWKDPKGDIDLDLSATFVGKEQTKILSYCTSYHEVFGCHSGDVRHRVGDCAEYVDIVLEEARKLFNYVIVDVRNFDRRTLGEVAPVFGYMEREAPESSLIWVPKTVKNSFVMTTKGISALAVAIDLQTLEYVILDMDMNGLPIAACNVPQMKAIVEAFLNPPKVSVYDLLTWHVEARGGQFVTDDEKETADNQFRFEDFSTSYVETLKWMRR